MCEKYFRLVGAWAHHLLQNFYKLLQNHDFELNDSDSPMVKVTMASFSLLPSPHATRSVIALMPSSMFVALLAAGTAQACMNSGISSRESEVVTIQLAGNLTKTIMGEFPEHTEAFWYHELNRHEARLEQDPEDVESLNDRAVALTKLQRYKEAEQAFLNIEDRFPNRYKTAANLGVLYKKTHRYTEGSEMIARSLEIKPSGHLGLGDYYQRMLAWRAKVAEDEEEAFRTNFLGISRKKSPAEIAADPRVNRNHLITLIKEDRHFADAYAVLGQVLLTEGPAQRPNAARAFQRAKELAPSPRMREHYDIGLATAAKNSRHDFDTERDAVLQWQTEYAAIEHQLLGQTKPTEIAPLMNVVYKHMAIQQTETPSYSETKTVYTYKSRPSPFRQFMVFSGIVAFGLLLLKGLKRMFVKESR